MEDKKVFGSLKQKMTALMGEAAEIYDKMPDKDKPVMDMVKAQIDATYKSLLISEGILFPASELKKKKQPVKKAFGQYGWVRLTEPQYAALIEKYGAVLMGRAITYIDEAAQKTGNKNGWRDFSLVIHNCIREDWGKVKSGMPKAPTTARDITFEMLLADFERSCNAG